MKRFKLIRHYPRDTVAWSEGELACGESELVGQEVQELHRLSQFKPSKCLRLYLSSRNVPVLLNNTVTITDLIIRRAMQEDKNETER